MRKILLSKGDPFKIGWTECTMCYSPNFLAKSQAVFTVQGAIKPATAVLLISEILLNCVVFIAGIQALFEEVAGLLGGDWSR